MKNFISRLSRYSYLLVFLSSAFFYYLLVFVLQVKMDIDHHADFILKIKQDGVFPANFLYYLVVYATALFSSDREMLLAASILVLAFAIAFKYFLTARFFESETGLRQSFGGRADAISNLAAIFLCTSFSIFLPVQLGLTKSVYLGQIPPNVWHNSTTIFLMPFALLLFWHSYRLLEKFEMKRIWLVVGLILLNLCIKPSFFFCFVVTFPLLALWQYKFKREFWLCLLPVLVGAGLMVLQYVAIYQFEGSLYQADKSDIGIAPFYVWGIWTNNIPISFLLSTAFPLAYLVLYFERVRASLFVQYAYLLFAVAVIVWSLFVEKGPRDFHANFLWQAVICNYILFFAVAADFAKGVFAERRLNLKDKIIAAAFALHLLSGWLYIIWKLLIQRVYS